MSLNSGRLPFVATAISPIHHGARSVGNSQILRVQDIVLPDGEMARVPFISGNSIKHIIRDGGARFALDAMGVCSGEISKQVVDLIFSGGHLSKPGSNIDLDRERKMEKLFPLLSACGYSAGNSIVPSKIHVDHMNLVCSENSFRMPASCVDLPQAEIRSAVFRSEEFGTRHAVRSGISKESKKNTPDKSTQMYYEYDVLVSGSVFYGEIRFRDLTEMEVAALRSAIENASIEENITGNRATYLVGAKASVGLGKMLFEFSDEIRRIVSTECYSNECGIMPHDGDADVDTMSLYIRHLRENKDEILAFLDHVMR